MKVSELSKKGIETLSRIAKANGVSPQKVLRIMSSSIAGNMVTRHQLNLKNT